MVTVGLAEKEKRDKELAMFKVAHSEACIQNQQQSADRVKKFEKYKLKVHRIHTLCSGSEANCHAQYGECIYRHVEYSGTILSL